MQQFEIIEPEFCEPLDEETKAAVEHAREQIRRGEGIPMEIAMAEVRERIEAWKKANPERRSA